jgi:hypothetical protein
MEIFTKQMVRDLESALKMEFTPGYTPGLRFMSHLWEDLRAHYRFVNSQSECNFALPVDGVGSLIVHLIKGVGCGKGY